MARVGEELTGVSDPMIEPFASRPVGPARVQTR